MICTNMGNCLSKLTACVTFRWKNITSGFNFATLSSLNQLTSLLRGLSLTNQKKKVRIRCKQRIRDLLKLTSEVMFTSPATSILLPPLIGNVYHIRKGQGGGQVRLRGLVGLPPWSLSRAWSQTWELVERDLVDFMLIKRETLWLFRLSRDRKKEQMRQSTWRFLTFLSSS